MSIKRVSRRTLQNLRGQVLFRVRVFDNIREISIIETASASSNNVKKDFNNLQRRAEANAIYKYLSRDVGAYRISSSGGIVSSGGTSVSSGEVMRSVFAEVLDVVDIRYEISDSMTIKRENHKGKYYTVIRNSDGTIVKKERWSNTK